MGGSSLSAQVCPCLHVFRKLLRALPCRPCLSASIEHSLDLAVRSALGALGFIGDADAADPGITPGVPAVDFWGVIAVP